MNRWIVNAVIMLGVSFSCWSQRSYCITLAGDTLIGNIRVEDNMLTIKQGKERRTFFPDEVVGYFDEKINTYFYSKPVRYTENTVVYGYLKLEVRGAINLYSRSYTTAGPAGKKRRLSKEDKELLEKYGEDTKSPHWYTGPNSQPPAVVEKVEYYLESKHAKIQMATIDIIYDFVRGDREATEKVGDPKFKIEKHLDPLIREYDQRHEL